MELETIRAFFTGDRFAVEIGMVIEQAVPGEAVCSMVLTPHHRNAKNAVMGGAIFTLGDFAFAVAANCATLGQKEVVVSLSNNITFCREAKGTRLIATAKELSATRRTRLYQVTVADDLGTLVAQMMVNGYASPVPPAGEKG